MASLSTALLEVFSFLLSFKGSFPSLVKYPLFDVFDFLTRHAHHAHGIDLVAQETFCVVGSSDVFL